MSWTPAEDAQLIAMRSNGVRFKHIARELNRPLSTISSRAIYLGAVRFNRVPKPNVPTKVTQTIEKHELPAYYAVGWRVDWFEGNQVGISRHG